MARWGVLAAVAGLAAAGSPPFPLDYSLRTVPALPKVHHSSYFDFVQVPTDSSNDVLVQYARITHAFPVDLNSDAEPIFNATTIFEAVKICHLATNCSLTLNFSPWCNNGGSWHSGPFGDGSARERHSLAYFSDRVSSVARWVEQANARLGANISIAAMLLDQEPGWAITPHTNASYLAAMKRKSDLIFNITVELLGEEVKIDMFGWGCIEKAMGLSKVPVGDPINGYANGGSVNGLWCGFGKGWG